MQTHVVIMAGGIGSRFWPMSTPEYPKQFIDVMGVGKSLIQLTVERFKGICEREFLGGDIGKVCRHSKGTVAADSGSAYSGGTGSKEYGAVYRVCVLEDPKGVSAGEHRGDAFGCAGD